MFSSSPPLIVPNSLRIVGHGRRKIGHGGKAGARAYPFAILIEQDGNGYERKGHKAQERTRPVDLERVEHVRGEERKHSTRQRSEEGVGGNGRGGAVEKRVSGFGEGQVGGGERGRTT